MFHGTFQSIPLLIADHKTLQALKLELPVFVLRNIKPLMLACDANEI